MFDKIKGMMNQAQQLQELMKDENVRAFISHPKVQSVFMDPEFQAIVKEKSFSKLVTHPKFNSLMQDPTVAKLLAKLSPQSFSQGLSQ